MMNQSLTEAIRAVAAVALQQADILVPEWLPEGKPRANEWVSRNPTRADRHAGSFSVSLSTGRWFDFATHDGGGDLVSLAAYLWNVRQVDAARVIADRFALNLPALGKPEPLSETQRAILQKVTETARAEAEQRKEQDKIERHRRQYAAALKAFDLLNDAGEPDPNHPYLRRKHIRPYSLYQMRDTLLVPLYDAWDALVNLQTISPDGRKLFLSDGRTRGAFCVIGDLDLSCDTPPAHEVYICEGWATGAALYQYWDVGAVVCAMTAGNLAPVALALRERYGHNIQLVIAADDDRASETNHGINAANEAALRAGCVYITPEFPPNTPAECSDFNDLITWEMANNEQKE